MTWRVVLDTNVAVSALLWRGTPHRVLLEMRRRPILFFSSRFLLDELSEVISRSKFDEIFARREMSRAGLVRHYTALVRLVAPVHVPEVIADDPTDNQVLACALAADADVIVSGDSHLLSVGAHAGIRIRTAGDFLRECS